MIIRSIFGVAAAALLCLACASPAAAESKPAEWPFGRAAPPNPALGLLDKIDSVSVDISKSKPQLVTITVKATAPRPGYGELTLVGKPGPMNDMTFAFELRGRPPQNMTADQKPTAVTLTRTYKDAPIASVKTVEIYADKNCIAYSVAEHATGDCKVKMPSANPGDTP